MAQLLPDPPMLDGTEGYSIFCHWRIKMRSKLDYFTRVISSKEYRVDYLASRLSGLAFEVVRPRLKYDMGAGQAWGSTNEMWHELEKLFKLPKDTRLQIFKEKFGNNGIDGPHPYICK